MEAADLLEDKRTALVTQVHYLPDFLSQEEIERVHKMVKKKDFESGDIMGGKDDFSIIVRQSKVKWIAGDEDSFWLYEKVFNAIAGLNDTIWEFDLHGVSEYLQYTEYQNEGSFYDWHMDVSHEAGASNRKLSFECILNDEHEGGEFSVLLGPIEQKIKLRKGSIIIFPSFLLNKVYPLISGKRTSVLGWGIGPVFR